MLVVDRIQDLLIVTVITWIGIAVYEYDRNADSRNGNGVSGD